MKDKYLIWVVLGLTALAKSLEWVAQYSLWKSPSALSFLNQIFQPRIMVMQMIFILLVASALFVLFHSFLGIKKQSKYILIPPLAYLTKEVWNLIFVYNFTINYVTIIALIVEPLAIYGIMYAINKSIFKWK